MKTGDGRLSKFLGAADTPKAIPKRKSLSILKPESEGHHQQPK